MPPYVECCLHNTDSTVRRRLRAGADETAATVEFRPCLQRCGPCYETPFLVVDGQLETGESHAALLESVEDTDFRRSVTPDDRATPESPCQASDGDCEW